MQRIRFDIKVFKSILKFYYNLMAYGPRVPDLGALDVSGFVLKKRSDPNPGPDTVWILEFKCKKDFFS